MERKCENCHHWTEDGLDGYCRRYAPRNIDWISIPGQVKDTTLVFAKYRTDDVNWCGDFKPKIS